MKNHPKNDAFYEAIKKAGLERAYSKICDISFDTLGCYLDDLIDDELWNEEKPVCRVRYDKDCFGEGEHYVFEYRKFDEEEWTFDSAFPLVSFEDGKLVIGKGDLLNYTALTKVREMMKYGYAICFK